MITNVSLYDQLCINLPGLVASHLSLSWISLSYQDPWQSNTHRNDRVAYFLNSTISEFPYNHNPPTPPVKPTPTAPQSAHTLDTGHYLESPAAYLNPHPQLNTKLLAHTPRLPTHTAQRRHAVCATNSIFCLPNGNTRTRHRFVRWDDTL